MINTCEACGNTVFRVLLDGLSHTYGPPDAPSVWRFRILECQRCGLGFTDPMPSFEVLQTFYTAEYGPYDPTLGAAESEANSLKYRLAKMRMATTSRGIEGIPEALVGLFIELATGRTVSYSLGLSLHLPHNARIFELGYGSGNWLLAMHLLGYRDLWGYDIESNHSNAGRLAEHGVQVRSGDFLQNEYEDGSFDCIRLEHVFEHLPNPLPILRKCQAMLKKNGLLFMVFPCKESWSMQISLVDAPTLDLPRHLYLHTQESARAMLVKSGFSPLRIRRYSVPRVLGVTMKQRALRYNRRFIPLPVFDALGGAYRLYSDITRRGDFITMLAVKR